MAIGGAGANIAISGTFVSYGGGGAGKSTSAATGGIGGGGNSDTSAANNTGGGGGGTSAGSFTNGGSGIVIINYPAPQYFTGGVVTNVNNLAGSNIVHTFNTSSTMTALATPIDTYQPYNTLLVHADGTNGSNNSVFLDSSVNSTTITRTGTATQGTFSPFSTTGWSNYFPTTSDYATAASNPGFGFSGAFTIELWAFFTTSASGLVTGVATAGGISLYENSSLLTANLYGTGDIFASTFNVANNLGKWLHIVLARGAGNAMNIWVNGTSYGTGTSATVFTTGAWYVTSTAGPKGYFSNLRVTNTDVYGVGNSTIIVPNSALSIVAGTLLLTCQSKRFVDNSSSPNTITMTGSPQVQPFSPFNPTAAYSNTVVGGSAYFNGSTDYLTTSTSSAFDLSTPTSWTIEWWMYPTITAGSYILQNYTTSGATIYGLDFNYNQQSAGTVSVGTYNGSSAGAPQFYLTYPVANNAWTHVAVVRNGSGTNNITLYINGAVANTGTYTTWPAPGNSTTYIGARNYTGVQNYFGGYISNLRSVIGNALYTSAFTPSSTPLTTVSNTAFLLNSTNAGIIDSSQKVNLISYGSAAISTTQSKFGGTSVSFNGTTDYILVPYSPLTGKYAGDFTVECWFYMNNTTGTQPIISQRTNSYCPYLVWVASGSLTLFMSSTNASWDIINGQVLGTITAGQWYHFALVRSSGSIKTYLNGSFINVGPFNSSATLDATSSLPLRIGGTTDPTYFNGYIDEVRITQGYARYTSNFTPQTSAFLNT